MPENIAAAYQAMTYALWAGDRAEYARLASKIGQEVNWRASEEEGTLDADDIMILEAVRRWRQVVKRRQQFAEDWLEGESTRSEVLMQPAVLETRHLRGTVSRSDVRQFALRAYLTDPAWADELLASARKLEAPTSDASSALSPESKGAREFRPLGASWIVEGQVFIRASVTDMGLIEANGLWTKKEIHPSDGEAVLKAFRSVLLTLDADVTE